MHPKCVVVGFAIAVAGAGSNRTVESAEVSAQVTTDSESIVTIRKAYRETERHLRDYRKVRRDLVGFSNEGGYLDAWFDGPQMRKLVATYYHETGLGSEQYYFVDDTVGFVIVTDTRYERPLSGHVVARDEDRFYFVRQRLVRWVDSTHQQRDPASHAAQDLASDVQHRARLLRACASAVASDTAACTAPE